MAAVPEGLVHAGMLIKVPRKSGTLRKSPKTYWFKLVDKSTRGIARLEYFDSETAEAARGTIPLHNCLSVQPLMSTKKFDQGVFEITTTERRYSLVAPTDVEMNQWVSKVSRCAFPALPVPPPQAEPYIAGEVQENLIYGSAEETTFIVGVRDTEDARRLKIVGFHNLCISSINLTLKDTSDVVLATWPIRYLRRYGRDKSGAFTFESGRKCVTGVGVFFLDSSQYTEIYDLVHNFAREMVGGKTLRGKTALPQPRTPALPAAVVVESSYSHLGTANKPAEQPPRPAAPHPAQAPSGASASSFSYSYAEPDSCLPPPKAAPEMYELPPPARPAKKPADNPFRAAAALTPAAATGMAEETYGQTFPEKRRCKSPKPEAPAENMYTLPKKGKR